MPDSARRLSQDLPDEERLLVTFRGGLAEENRLPLDQFRTSLAGWETFLRLTATTYATRRMNVTPSERRLSFFVEPVRPGSIEVILVAGGMMGLMVSLLGTQAEPWTDGLWKWRKRAVETQFSSRLRQVTVEEAAANLRVAADEFGVEVRGEDDPVAFVKKIDKAIETAASPAGRGADEAELVPLLDESEVTPVDSTTEKAEPIVLDERRRTLFAGGYAEVTQPARIEDVQTRLVRFRRMNRNSSNSSFVFEEPLDESEEGAQSCRITDPRFKLAGDKYTGAFHNNVAAEVHLRKKILNEESGAHRWDVIAEHNADLFSDAPPA